MKDCLGGILAGLTSIAVSNYQLRLKAQDTDFRCKKVSGAPHATISSDGKYVDICLFELQFGQKVGILLEMVAGKNDNTVASFRVTDTGEHEDPTTSAKSMTGSEESQIPKNSSFTGEFYGSASSASQCEDLEQISNDSLEDDIPVFELDCTYQDPAAGRLVSRLSHPILLTVGFDPRNLAGELRPQCADLVVARRRYELVASESITRALLLVSRQNWHQAERVLQETSNILETIIANTINVLSRQVNSRVGVKREAQANMLLDSLRGILSDIDILLEGIEESKETFDRDHRNFGAQQVSTIKRLRVHLC